MSIPNDLRSQFRRTSENIRGSRPYRQFRQGTKEVQDFYLTEEQRKRLATMSPPKRSLYMSGWLLRAMFNKLAPVRQAMFIIGLIFLVRVQASVGENNSLTLDFNAFLGGLLLSTVILLELKDKLLAHDELEEGRKIQESLMPERVPTANGWRLWLYTRSANEVCGDLIDFLRVEEGHFSVAMADVSGKGLHAALITAKLQATLRALAGEIRSLPELMGKVNSIVHRDSPARIFSSLFYAECSETDGTVRFVNAGHFPAIVLRGTTMEETGKGEPALGLARSVAYTEHTATLNTGDRFILYSDGLTEAKNEAGEFFGRERLVKTLTATEGTPERTGFAVLQALEQFAGDQPPADDLSLIILQKL